MSWHRSGCLTQFPICFVLVAFSCALLPGCVKPAANELIAVSGRVTLDGQPLPSGSVSLRAEAGPKNWDQPTGAIASDGKYVIFTNGHAGAAPGTYRVVIFASAAPQSSAGRANPGLPQSLIPARYNDPGRTPLKIEVKASSKPNPYDLELTRHDS